MTNKHYIHMNKKQLYTSPEVELLVLRGEETILTGSLRLDSVNSGYEEENDLGEI